MAFEHWDGIAVKLAGIGGAIVSMKFLQGTWPERLSMAVCGAIFSYFVAPWMAQKLGIPEGLAGFMLGLFGMAIVSRMWEWLQTTPISAFWNILLSALRKFFGLKEPEDKESPK